MSVLEKLRQRNGLLVAIVGLALVTFVITGLLERGSIGSGGSDVVGEISGKTIKYHFFNQKVEEAAENRKQNEGKNTLTEREMDEVVTEVWNRLINEEIMAKEYQKIGITVSPDEIYDMMVVHPHPYFVRYITDPNTGRVNPIFTDPNTGQVSPAKLKDFVQNMTPEQEAQWAPLEELMRQIRIIEKYNVLIKKGMYVTKSQAKHLFEAQNTNVDVTYTFKAFQTIFDNVVKYTDDDLNDYYVAHKNEFKQETSRSIEYVSFDFLPSEEDKALVLADMQKVAEKLKAEKPFADDSLLAVTESDSRMMDMTYYTKGTMAPSIDSVMFAQKKGYVKEPFLENGIVKIAKLMNTKISADSAKVRHILISYAGAGASPTVTRTKEQAKTMADSLRKELKGRGKKGNTFADLVEKYSDDGGKNKPADKKDDEYYMGKGGDYGWINATSQFVEEFKNAALDGDEGDITVVESQFGFHIIEILKSKGAQKKVQVAMIERRIVPSTKTMQALYLKASEFSGKNNTVELFQKAVEEQHLNKRISSQIKESDRVIPGIESSRQLIRWVYENKKGTVSEPKDVGGRYVVVAITDEREKGYATLEQVKEEVIEGVIKQKKAELIKEQFNSAKQGGATIDQIATKLGLYSTNNPSLNFTSTSMMAVGNELGLIGAISAMKPKTMSEPLVGKTGVLLCFVNAVNIVPAPADYNAQKQQELSKLQMRVDFDEVFNALKEKANVQDHLIRFY